MATVQKPQGTFDSAATGRRVRHPLDAVRGHIRRYVLLEGLAVALLYLAICFWAGLALDYGLFRLFAFDWVQELQQLTIDPVTGGQGNVDSLIRGTLLCLFLGGLLVLVVWKVLLRVTREFSDPAIALVLERRFPGELGDRLITAVEMADPRLADRYGFSKALIENTIQDAADRVEKVPVKLVFDWGRLRVLGLWCGLLTLGMYVAVGIGASLYGVVVQGAAAPVDFFWNFNDTAAIWVERNILLMDSYWPRRAYLEVIRFQDTSSHRNEMRVGRDEQRPDVQIRAIEWAIADRASPDGWRRLRWRDLPLFVDHELLDEVRIPPSWGQWLVDLDDLDPNIPGGILPSSWQGKTVAEAHQELAGLPILAASAVGLTGSPCRRGVLTAAAALNPVRTELATLRENLEKAKAEQAALALLDWRSWTLDKIQLQERKGEIRRALREEHPQALHALEEVFSKVAELAQEARYSRTLRRLHVPGTIRVYYRGATTKSDRSHEIQADNKYAVGLNDLQESVRFTARGEDYYTPHKKITLVPPPGIKLLTVDKEEPAYIYYRVHDAKGEQSALKGKKQLFYGYTISNMGDASTIQVPLGTNLVLRAQTDRPLKDGVRMRAPAKADERGAAVPNVPVVADASGTRFAISLANVVKPYEFVFEFNDRDNVKGRRRLRIQPIDDRPPEVLDVELDVVLRKPRFKADPARPAAGPGADGYLITPIALLPFKGTLRDDYGLTRAEWVYEVEQRVFELIGPGLGDKVDNAPGPAPEKGFKAREAREPFKGFQLLLEARSAELPPHDVDQMIREHAREQKRKQKAQEEEKKYLPEKRAEPRPLVKEYSLKDEIGFDLKQVLPRLKALDPRKEAQFHYLVKISVEATDNNVETGPGASRNKAPFTFLVISENELLGQIAIEEEVLRDRLDKAAFKLRNAKTSIDEQIGKLSMTLADYSLVSIRVDDARKTLLDGGTAAREVYNDYRRIVRELDVNRVERKKKDVEDKIAEPLKEIVDPNIGNFTTTETALEKLYAGLDDDLTLKRGGDNRLGHLENARIAAVQLDRLLQKLNEVLIAMSEGVFESKLLELLVNMEREQRGIAERARLIHNREVEKLLDILTQPKSK